MEALTAAKYVSQTSGKIGWQSPCDHDMTHVMLQLCQYLWTKYEFLILIYEELI